MALVVKRRPDAAQRFPFIPLPRAIERCRELYKLANGHEVPLSAAMKAWAYAEKSSGGLQTVAALKAFGLVEDVGGGDVRKVKLTDTALRIIRDPRDISPDRDALIREAALKPPLHRDVIEKYDGLPPSDEALKAFLLIDRGLKDEAVPEFIREFMATMTLAKAVESGIIQDMEGILDTRAENVAGDLSRGARASAGPEAIAAGATLHGGGALVATAPGERVVFTEESDPQRYVKLIASGELDESLLDALSDYLKRQRKRLGLPESAQKTTTRTD
jgi:hypothetical protein